MAAFTVIDHTELGAAASSWDVTSIPSSYDHLLIVASARSDEANTLKYLMLNFNGDTGTNYSNTRLMAVSSTPSSDRDAGKAFMKAGMVTAASVLADSFGTFKCWIPNYANTANFKQAAVQTSTGGSSTSDWWWSLNVDAGLWSSTAAINQVTLAPGADDFVQYSTFTLYGVTGA